jgi:hypothetical protein
MHTTLVVIGPGNITECVHNGTRSNHSRFGVHDMTDICGCSGCAERWGGYGLKAAGYGLQVLYWYGDWVYRQQLECVA